MRPTASTPPVTGESCGEPSRRRVTRIMWCRGRAKSSSALRSTGVFVAMDRGMAPSCPLATDAMSEQVITLERKPPPARKLSERLPVNDRLIVRGAREHNLKDVNLDLPRDALIVFTGLSGSGKSSLAFDTIFAEGQRRYVESLSSYARQFLGQMDKPDVDFIEGLSPAVSIDQ